MQNCNHIQSHKDYTRSQEIHADQTVRLDGRLLRLQASCFRVILFPADGEAFRFPGIVILRGIIGKPAERRGALEVLHLSIVASTFVLLFIGTPVIALIIFLLIEIWINLKAHLTEHRAHPRRDAGSES